MSEQTKHTPVALNLQDAAKTLIHVDAVMADGDTRAVFSIPKGEAALANEIYRRYNSHAALVEALQSVVDDLTYGTCERWRGDGSNKLREVLKLARGKA